ncbi:MAG: FG-GAP repeat protein, partial [Verrucomicrobiae bacterium]|nr:FG-GAP repeat protein [Verrucomicrobiae bacterium]
MGAAYLMDVLSGRLIHRFQASPAVSDDLFGSSVALSDRYVLIALPGRSDGKGLVEIFETLSGDHEEYLDPMDLAANDAFGSSLALSGQLALVGAPFEGNNEGAAYLFDLRARQLLRKLVSPNRAAGRLFGYDVALDGDRAVVGEPGNGPGGKAYFFDLQTNGAGVEFPDSAGSFGNQVELDGGLALIGAPDDETAYLYDVSRMERLRILTASDGLNAFGQHVAFRGEQALFGVRSSGGGSVHYIRPLAGPLPMDTVTQTRNYAPGVIQGDFSRFYQPLINPDGEVFFTAGLTGPGTTGGRNQGLWTNFQGDLDTVGIVGGSAEIVGPGLKTGRLLRFVSSRADSMVFEAQIKGPGVTARNNRVLLTFDGTQANQLRTGTPLAALGNAEIQSLQEILHTGDNPPNSTPTDRILLPYRLQSGTGGVTATNDTGLLLADSFGGGVGATKEREGQPARGADTFGQFFGRAAASTTTYYGFSAFVIPDGGGPPLRQCFTTTAGGNQLSVVREGDQAPGLGAELDPAETFRNVLGEVVDLNGFGIARALRGGTPSANQFAEGFWKESGDALMIGRGTELDATLHPVTGQPVGSFLASRFLRF